MHNSLFRKPSALIPLSMSLAALIMPFAYVAFNGLVHHDEEGLAARLWQLLLLAQLLAAALFAAR